MENILFTQYIQNKQRSGYLREFLTLTSHTGFTDENVYLCQSTCTSKIFVLLLHLYLHCQRAPFIVLFSFRFRFDFTNSWNSNSNLRVCLHRVTHQNSHCKYLGIYISSSQSDCITAMDVWQISLVC